MAAFTLVQETDADGAETIYIEGPDGIAQGDAVDSTDIATLFYDGRLYIATCADNVEGMDHSTVYVVGAAQETVCETTDPADEEESDTDPADDDDDDTDDELDIVEEGDEPEE